MLSLASPISWKYLLPVLARKLENSPSDIVVLCGLSAKAIAEDFRVEGWQQPYYHDLSQANPVGRLHHSIIILVKTGVEVVTARTNVPDLPHVIMHVRKGDENKTLALGYVPLKAIPEGAWQVEALVVGARHVQIQEGGDDLVVAGDFNARNLQWTLGQEGEPATAQVVRARQNTATTVSNFIFVL